MNRRAAWALRARVAALVGAALVFTALVSVLAWVSVRDLVEARRQVVDRVDPAAIAATELTVRFLDEESALRGYVLTGAEDFLGPYVHAAEELDDLADQLRALAGALPGGPGPAAELARMGEEWRAEVAEPVLAAREAGDVDGARDLLVASKARFDALREGRVELDAQLAQARQQAVGELNAATRRLVASVAVMGVALLAIVAGAALALRRWVLDPLLRIGADTRQVASGQLDHQIVPTGPPELGALASDAEAMRRRIVSELEAVEEAQRELGAQARELARSNAELEQFAYVASHDLQEPLRKVASFVELLRRRYGGQLDERADQYIDYAVDGAKRMQVLINDLLAFSRVGRVTDGFDDVDCNEVVDVVLGQVQLAVEDSGAEVRVGELPTVHGERSLLSLLFKNLVENAIKFRGEAPPLVDISASPGPAEGEWTFRVRDNGIGIAPEYRDKVFVIFQRLHSREQYPGTGIGLAMCRKVVEYHGGHIWIEDVRGQPGVVLCWTLATRPPERSEEQDAA